MDNLTTLPCAPSGMLGKSPALSELEFAHLHNEENNASPTMRLDGSPKTVLIWCLAFRRLSRTALPVLSSSLMPNHIHGMRPHLTDILSKCQSFR